MDIQLFYIDPQKATLRKYQDYLSEYFDVFAFTNPFECLENLGKGNMEVILMNDHYQTAANINFFNKLDHLFPYTLKILMVNSPLVHLPLSVEIPLITKSEFKRLGCNLIKKYIDEFYCRNFFFLKMSDNRCMPTIIGSHPNLMEQIKIARRMATFSENVLITGETGTGKDLFAKFIHFKSERKAGPCHIVNCASIQPSLFEAEFFGHKKGAFTGALETSPGHFYRANEGTLVLDEVSEIDLVSQAKLLRAIENQEFYPVGSQKLCKVNIRIIAVSNKNLEDQVQKGTFRKDLYHRINTFSLRLPSLRERITDIEYLARYFMARFCVKYSQKQRIKFEENIIHYLKELEFPGNIRELENVVYTIMSHIYSRDGKVKLEEIKTLLNKPTKKYIRPAQHLSLREYLKNIQYETVRHTFQDNNGNVSRTASSLGISRQNLQYLLKKYRLKNRK